MAPGSHASSSSLPLARNAVSAANLQPCSSGGAVSGNSILGRRGGVAKSAVAVDRPARAGDCVRLWRRLGRRPDRATFLWRRSTRGEGIQDACDERRRQPRERLQRTLTSCGAPRSHESLALPQSRPLLSSRFTTLPRTSGSPAALSRAGRPQESRSRPRPRSLCPRFIRRFRRTAGGRRSSRSHSRNANTRTRSPLLPAPRVCRCDTRGRTSARTQVASAVGWISSLRVI